MNNIEEVINKEYLRGILSVIYMEGATHPDNKLIMGEIIDRGIDAVINEIKENTGLEYE